MIICYISAFSKVADYKLDDRGSILTGQNFHFDIMPTPAQGSVIVPTLNIIVVLPVF
jgi:hypothetical protein